MQILFVDESGTPPAGKIEGYGLEKFPEEAW